MEEKKNTYKVPLAVSIRPDLAQRLAEEAKKERRSCSAVFEGHMRHYLAPELVRRVDGRIMRKTRGPSRSTRYSVTKDTYDKVMKAEENGYSRAYLVEEALKEGFGITE